MKYPAILITFIILSTTGASQDLKPAKINPLRITDTILIKYINKVLNNEIISQDSLNPFKKGYGYISVHLKAFSKGDTIRKYHIVPELYAIKESDPDRLYPDYYSYVNERLVLIYLEGLESFSHIRFSKKTKRRLRKRVNSVLVKPYVRTFYNMKGEKLFKDKEFRLDYFRFDPGLTVFILKDETVILR